MAKRLHSVFMDTAVFSTCFSLSWEIKSGESDEPCTVLYLRQQAALLNLLPCVQMAVVGLHIPRTELHRQCLCTTSGCTSFQTDKSLAVGERVQPFDCIGSSCTIYCCARASNLPWHLFLIKDGPLLACSTLSGFKELTSSPLDRYISRTKWTVFLPVRIL